MSIKVDPPDEIMAAVAGAAKAALTLSVPLLGIPFSAYEERAQRRTEKEFEEYQAEVRAKLERLETKTRAEWARTPEGQSFAEKVIDAALDVQQSGKRRYFCNALINGFCSDDLTYVVGLKFADILRGLSLAALAVLTELHRRYGPATTDPRQRIHTSTYIAQESVAREVSAKLGLDPYMVESAVAELVAAGLFSSVRSWTKDAAGVPVSSGGYAKEGPIYTEFTERFVQFIQDPK